MGFLNWFSSRKEEEEEASEGIVRYLGTFEKEYDSQDAFMEDFYNTVSETIKRYNVSNPIKVGNLDRNQAYRAGGRWIYEASVVEDEGEGGDSASGEEGQNVVGSSTFKVIAREQPNFGMELSGEEHLIDPFLKELKNVLKEKGHNYEFKLIARPGLGKET